MSIILSWILLCYYIIYILHTSLIPCLLLSNLCWSAKYDEIRVHARICNLYTLFGCIHVGRRQQTAEGCFFLIAWFPYIFILMSFAFTSSLSLCSKENSILDFYYIVHIWLLAITELFLQFSHYTRLRKKNTWLPSLEVLLGIFRLLFSLFYMRLLPLSPFLPRKMTHFNCSCIVRRLTVHKVS